jgi:MoaA/NifB/PqqE/SkfB family radical SAM enzyme
MTLDYRNGYRPDATYPAAMVNITNRCNLSCAHCFVFRDDNPNEALSPRREPTDDEMLALLTELRDRHGIRHMLWMGGEPLLRKTLLRAGVDAFESSTVTTNGTLPLVDLGPAVLYVVSLDGPRPINDAVRGRGSFDRVIANLRSLPADFASPVQVQCTVTPVNEAHLEELLVELRDTPVGWMTFSFIVPSDDEQSELCWPTLEARMVAVREVLRLKAAYPGFVRNRTQSLELMAPEHAPDVTAHCPSKTHVLPLWLDGDRFTTPFCCYGNDVDCSRCGAWVVFDLAARATGRAST